MQEWQVGPDIHFATEYSLICLSENAHFDFFGDGRYLAMQVDSVRIALFDMTSGNREVASLSCSDFNIPCQMFSFTSVSERGSLILQSLSGYIFHVSTDSDVGSEKLASVTWGAALVTTKTFDRSALSKNGRVLISSGTVEASIETENPSVITSFKLGENNAWDRMADDLVLDKGLIFDSVAALSSDGHTIALSLSELTGSRLVVKTFRFDGESEWGQLGRPDKNISMASPHSVSLLYDASVLSVANPSGQAETFYLSKPCRSGESYYRVFMLLEADRRVRWSLGLAESDVSDLILTSPDYPLGKRLKILEQLCLPEQFYIVLNITTDSSQQKSCLADDDSLLSVIVDNKEVLNLNPTKNGSYMLAGCGV